MHAELLAELRMPQRIVDRRLQVAELFTGVVAAAFEHVSVEIAAANELAQRIGQLNFATGAALRLREHGENLRRQDVASDDGVARRRIDLRLLDHLRDSKSSIAEHLAAYDSVARRLILRHFHQRDDGTSRLLEHASHLFETRLVGEDYIIRQQDRERFAADR